MNKKRFSLIIAVWVVALAGLVVYGGLVVYAKYSIFRKQLPIIGVVNTAAALDPSWDGLRAGLDELGYRDGEQISLRYQSVAGGVSDARAATERFVNDGASLLVAIGVEPALAAQEMTKAKAPDLPVVFLVVSDPVGNGIVADVQAPAGNITGVTPANETVSGKRLELFKEAVPSLKRVIFVYGNARTAGLERVQEVSHALGVELVEQDVRDAAEYEQFFTTFAFRAGDGILRSTDSISASRLPFLANLARGKRIPLAGTNRHDADNGALISYGANYFDLGKQGARLVARILSGASPAALSVELPRRFELAVNLAVAQAIDVQFSRLFLQRVDYIIPVER